MRALRACSPRGVSAVHSIASGGGVPTDEQTTGLEMEAMMAAWKGLDPCNMLAPKAALGMKKDPNIVLSITNKQMVGCIYEEGNSALISSGSGCTKWDPAIP